MSDKEPPKIHEWDTLGVGDIGRYAVPGGWLYQVKIETDTGSTWSAPVFVPATTVLGVDKC